MVKEDNDPIGSNAETHTLRDHAYIPLWATKRGAGVLDVFNEATRVKLSDGKTPARFARRGASDHAIYVALPREDAENASPYVEIRGREEDRIQLHRLSADDVAKAGLDHYDGEVWFGNDDMPLRRPRTAAIFVLEHG